MIKKKLTVQEYTELFWRLDLAETALTNALMEENAARNASTLALMYRNTVKKDLAEALKPLKLENAP